MLIGIDGTGPLLASKYSEEMRNSFVSQIVRSSREKHKYYFSGPSLLGAEDLSIEFKVVSAVLKCLAAGDSILFLTGYSRGGLIAIRVARNIQSSKPGKNLRIKCLMLFDAVDRDAFSGSSIIPSNVDVALHAIRSPDVGSRKLFGNCGLRFEGNVNFQRKTFQATHAAMGGMPWSGDFPTSTSTQIISTPEMYRIQTTTPALILTTTSPNINKQQDISGAAAVKGWAWNSMSKYGMI